MANVAENWSRILTKNQEETAGLMQRFFDVARPQAVYGEPLTVGEQVVITASEHGERSEHSAQGETSWTN